MADNPSNTPDLDLDDALPVEINWPKTVGIVSIVWGSLGCICNCFSALSPIIRPNQPTLPYAAPLALLGVALSITVLVSGILCVQRKPVARWMHLVWAALSLISMVVGTVIFHQHKATLLDATVQQAVDDQRARGNSNMTAEQFRGFIEPVMTFMAIAVPAVMSLWPVFCLVWFGLVKRTRESMVGKASD